MQLGQNIDECSVDVYTALSLHDNVLQIVCEALLCIVPIDWSSLQIALLAMHIKKFAGDL